MKDLSVFEYLYRDASNFKVWGSVLLRGSATAAHLARLRHCLAGARSLHPHHVWTVLEGGEGSDQWITPGLHYVNRICYLVTRVPHVDAPIAFRIESKPRPITTIGLARRITTLRRLLVAHQASA